MYRTGKLLREYVELGKNGYKLSSKIDLIKLSNYVFNTIVCRTRTINVSNSFIDRNI